MKRTFIYGLTTMLIALIAITNTGCKKDKSNTDNTSFQEATVVYTGLVGADGCDWIIRITPTEEYRPVNLPDTFKVTGKLVEIKYDILSTKWICGFAPARMSEINLRAIQAK